MKKVIVIGCPGAGKSIFAAKLHRLTGLPLYHLDLIWHKPDRSTLTRAEFDRRLQEILGKDQWIIDGNYRRTLKDRLKACDTVFLFDLPVEICLKGAESRIGKVRQDLPWVETEFDEEFRQSILNFSRDVLPEIDADLKEFGQGKSIHIFHSREEAEEFLREQCC